MKSLRGVVRGVAPVGLAALVLSLVGCGNFFIKQTSGGGTTGTTGSYVYASNSATSSTSIGAYALASGTPVALTGSPFSLSFSPTAMAVNPANTFLYATSISSNVGVYVYTIASATGIPSIGNGGAAVVSQAGLAMDISPDGKYLFVLDANGSTFTEYSINATTGLLTFVNTVTYSAPLNSLPTPQAIKVAPSGQFIAIALGTGGIVIFPYSAGTVNPTYITLPARAGTGDFSVTLDNSNFMYVGETNTLAVYSLSTTGTPTLVGTPASTGTGPRSVTVYNSAVYAANSADGTISAFSIGGTGTLTVITGSPFASAASVSALGIDNSGKYLVALGGAATGGLRVYAIGTGGVLTSTGTGVATGTTGGIPLVMALTH
jgi:6-phosphogluconolactonase